MGEVNEELLARYGAYEENSLEASGVRHEDTDCSESVGWDDPDLEAIVRLRLLSDVGFPLWDVSYCLGRMRDGRQVHVDLPFHQVPKGQRYSFIREQAAQDGVDIAALCGGDIDRVMSVCQ